MTQSWWAMERGLLIGVAALLSWGCEKNSGSAAAGTEPGAGGEEAALCSIQDAINYSEHISNVLNSNCAGCHGSTRVGADRHSAPVGVDFDGPEDARQSAEAANRRIQANEMPPVSPLNACEKEAFQGWVESGAPR